MLNMRTELEYFDPERLTQMTGIKLGVSSYFCSSTTAPKCAYNPRYNPSNICPTCM